MPLRLAIVSTHPIQYYAPVFRALAACSDLDVRLFYTFSQSAAQSVFDSGFGADVKWDIPLLEGYAYQFVRNVARRPGLDHFRGLDTPTLTREIEDWKPDAVLVYTWNSLAHLRALRYFKGRVPVLFRGDSTLMDPRPWWKRALRRVFLKWVYGHVDVAIAVGTRNHDYFAWCGVPENRIARSPHSVDTVRFRTDCPDHDQLVATWRLDMRIAPESLVILFAGKLQPKKNPGLLLDAFRTLNDESHLIFVGNGELERELKVAAGSLDRVHFMPFQNQSVMPAVYRLGDVFVLPSKGPEETWGLAVNEAMASGRPVIASTMVGGACDLVRSGENGWIFESGNLQALAETLRCAAACGRVGLRAMGLTAQSDSSHWSSKASADRIRDAVLAAVRGSQDTRKSPELQTYKP